MDRLRPPERRNLVATMPAAVTEGMADMWWQLVGPVGTLSIVSDASCNWRASPAGTAQEIATIEHTVALVQAEHPNAVR